MLSEVTQAGSGEASIQNAKTRTVSFYLLWDLRSDLEHEAQDLYSHSSSVTLGRTLDLSKLQLPHLHNEMHSTRQSLLGPFQV